MKNWKNLGTIKVVVRIYYAVQTITREFKYSSIEEAFKELARHPYYYKPINTKDQIYGYSSLKVFFYDELDLLIDENYIVWLYNNQQKNKKKYKSAIIRGSKRYRWRKSKSWFRDFSFIANSRENVFLNYDEDICDYKHMIKKRNFKKRQTPWDLDPARERSKSWKNYRKTQWK